MGDDPYRSTALTVAKPRTVVAYAKRSTVAAWIGGVSLIASLVTLMIDPPLGLGALLVLCYAAVAWFTRSGRNARTRKHNLAVLGKLPFRIVLEPGLRSDVGYVESVTIRLARSPSRLDLERLAGDAHRIARMLALSRETETTIALTRWPDNDDFASLAAVLTAWGTDLHTDFVILEAYVAGSSRPWAS